MFHRPMGPVAYYLTFNVSKMFNVKMCLIQKNNYLLKKPCKNNFISFL